MKLSNCRRIARQGGVAALAAALALPAAAVSAPPAPIRPSPPAPSASPAPSGKPPGRLALVDDRGEPLAGPVKVCFVLDLETDCVEVVPPARSVELRPGRLLRVEGPGYGPVTVERASLVPGDDGRRTLRVPRKARLVVSGVGDASLDAVLFPTADPDFDRPAYSYDLVPARVPTPAPAPVEARAEVAIPAGEYVLALEARGAAPDLHRLEAPPGSEPRVTFRSRAGGSLVIRALAGAGADAAPVAGAAVQAVRPRPPRPPASARPRDAPAEPAPPPPPTHRVETDAHGLALLSGLDEPVLDVTVAHPDFVQASLHAVSIAPGALEHREVALSVGGVVEARISVQGEPAARWRCRILDRSSPLVGDADGRHSREVASVEAGEDGRCRLAKLPEGRFWLRVAAPKDGGGTAEREVQVADGETTRINLDLAPISIEGHARQGGEPLPGYTVAAYRLSETGSTLLVEAVAEATTDDDGHYRTAVWDPGAYSVDLLDPAGRHAASQHVEAAGDSEEVDFDLAAADLVGRVVDQDGKPLEGASVRAVVRTGNGSGVRSGQSGKDGSFSFPLATRVGTAELSAWLDGYRPSPKVERPLSEGTVPAPVTLVLTRGELLHGRLLSAVGAPVSKGSIFAYPLVFPPGSGGSELSGHASVAADGSFAVLPAEGPSTRLFATGIGCPLTSAVVPSSSEEPVVVTCAASAGTLVLHFKDASGQPVGGEAVILRSGDAVFPMSVLGSHLLSFGQRPLSDASGTLTIPDLAPGRFDVYRFGFTHPAEVAQGQPQGYEGSAEVEPGQVTELDVQVANP